jgi:hypothetical protein
VEVVVLEKGLEVSDSIEALLFERRSICAREGRDQA